MPTVPLCCRSSTRMSPAPAALTAAPRTQPAPNPQPPQTQPAAPRSARLPHLRLVERRSAKHPLLRTAACHTTRPLPLRTAPRSAGPPLLRTAPRTHSAPPDRHALHPTPHHAPRHNSQRLPHHASRCSSHSAPRMPGSSHPALRSAHPALRSAHPVRGSWRLVRRSSHLVRGKRCLVLLRAPLVPGSLRPGPLPVRSMRRSCRRVRGRFHPNIPTTTAAPAQARAESVPARAAVPLAPVGDRAAVALVLGRAAGTVRDPTVRDAQVAAPAPADEVDWPVHGPAADPVPGRGPANLPAGRPRPAAIRPPATNRPDRFAAGWCRRHPDCWPEPPPQRPRPRPQ